MKRLIFLTLLLCSSVFASEYPSKPIRMVLGMPAGSTIPIITKAITDNVPDKSFVFYNDHKVGQGNLLAQQFAAASKPDGLTVLFASTSVVINPLLYKDAGFSHKDFVPVMLFGKVDNAILVHPSLPFKSISGLLKYAKANPGKILYGHNGFATQSYLGIELMAFMANVQLMSIPYSSRGTDTAMLDLYSGQIFMHMPVIGRAAGYVNTGKVKMIATTGTTRSHLFPDVPTVGESLKGFSSSIWYSFLTNSGTNPADVVKLRNQMVAGLSSEPAQKILKNTGVDYFTMDNKAFTEFMDAESAKWKTLLKAKGIQPK